MPDMSETLTSIRGEATNAANTCQRRNERHAYSLITYMRVADEQIAHLTEQVQMRDTVNADLKHRLTLAVEELTRLSVEATLKSQEETEKPFWKFW